MNHNLNWWSLDMNMDQYIRAIAGSLSKKRIGLNESQLWISGALFGRF
jgi:hypothetical protein